MKSSKNLSRINNNENRKIGLHLSIAGGIYKSLERAKELRINALQIFLKNSNRWEAPPYREDDINKFRQMSGELPEISIFAHSGYLINLAGTGEILTKSKNALIDEIKRASTLGIKYLVIHPGSHGGRGLKDGIKSITESIDYAFGYSENSSVKILLELTAGQGFSIGHSFEHIQEIIQRSDNSRRLKVCLDTSHVYAAGYDISDVDGYKNTMVQFNRIIGLSRLNLIHLNDSKKVCGSRVDRHEHIGKGFIGNSGFKMLLNDPKLAKIPCILETPKTDDSSDSINLNRVRKMIKSE